MGLARIETRFTTVLKDYLNHPDGERRWTNEVTAYQEIPWATPALAGSNPRWLEVERLTPILDLTKDQSRRYKEPLRELVQAVHDAGFWHNDIDLVNVVVHPVHGVRLIDWENLTEATGPLSVDLYGARVAGVTAAWPESGPDGVFWASKSPTSPQNYWH